MRDVAGERHLVRRHEDRRALLRERPHQIEHLADELGIEGGRDLVEQQNLGVGRDGPGDRDTLLLPAGQPIGVFGGLVGEPDALEQIARPRASASARCSRRVPARRE